MFYIVGSIVSCIIWGVLLALLLTAILFYLPGMLSARYGFTFAGLLLLVAGFCFFTFQSTLLAGGFKVKGYIPSANQIEQLGIGQTSPEAFGEELINRYPALQTHIRKIMEESSGMQREFSTVTESVRFIRAKLYRMVNNYIWRRVGWIVGGMFLLGFYFVNDASKQSRRTVVRRKRMPEGRKYNYKSKIEK
jgi:hypothetical protein